MLLDCACLPWAEARFWVLRAQGTPACGSSRLVAAGAGWGVCTCIPMQVGQGPSAGAVRPLRHCLLLLNAGEQV